MRAVQRAIIGIGLALVGVVAAALLLVGTGSTGSDSTDATTQADGTQPRLTQPSGPEPIDAAQDTSVGTLPPPPDATAADSLMSRDLLEAPATTDGSQTPGRGPQAAQKSKRPLAAARERSARSDRDDHRWDGWRWDKRKWDERRWDGHRWDRHDHAWDESHGWSPWAGSGDQHGDGDAWRD